MPKRQLTHVATEDEIVEVAKELGHLDEHGNYPRHLRKKFAKVAELTANEHAERAEATERAGDFVTEIVDLHRSLTETELPEFVVGEVVARVAPAVYNRTTAPKGNRTS
ncbi:hypothetical protein QLQ77_gp14 [Gordonia phage Reyja]|uniref:Uncharacterized protein n=1 Tax=Gordonia phage Reyja TaxID=2571250 RepID=A0A4D6T6Q9_9CAUD|nr:hypothetical protein QLQ77_gp14 [Gordonia phage Reyja]QCG77760.1 hypothetical protein SEA_REYJA_14 [Gordonia phage Reyja]